MRFFIPVFFVVVLVQGFPVHAQDTLRGKVVDEANVPISWAYIISEEGVIVSATDSAGVFRMPYSAKPDTLMVQKFGFKKKPFPTNQEFITIQMEEEVRELPEVVVGQDFEDYLLDQYFEKREDNYLSTEEMGPYSTWSQIRAFQEDTLFSFLDEYEVYCPAAKNEEEEEDGKTHKRVSYAGESTMDNVRIRSLIEGLKTEMDSARVARLDSKDREKWDTELIDRYQKEEVWYSKIRILEQKEKLDLLVYLTMREDAMVITEVHLEATASHKFLSGVEDALHAGSSAIRSISNLASGLQHTPCKRRNTTPIAWKSSCSYIKRSLFEETPR